MKPPDFKSAEEERKFWEKHSISNYWEDLKASDDTFKRPKLTPVTIKFVLIHGVAQPIVNSRFCT
jgi:hypothetical protein